MDEQKLNWAAGIIKNAMANEKTRGSRGAIRRKQMQEALERGDEPTGPRADWLKQTASEIMKVLELAAIRFNEENLDDLISANDLGDAVLTSMKWLQAAGSGKKTETTKQVLD